MLICDNSYWELDCLMIGFEDSIKVLGDGHIVVVNTLLIRLIRMLSRAVVCCEYRECMQEITISFVSF